jgi:hypothetical protein
MPKIYNRNFYKTFNTNSGFCFLFTLEDQREIFATSDTKILNERIVKNDELRIGKKLYLEDVLYEIKEIRAFSNYQFLHKTEINLSGKPYQYNFVLNLIIERINI